MDIATIVGFIAFVTALMVGIGSHLELVIETPLLIMVFGGGLALTLIALPLQHVVGLAGVVVRTLFTRVTVPTQLVESATHMAAMARAEGILALEQEVEGNAHDRFLSQGIILAVDGTEPDLIMDILETEVQFIKERHDQAQRAVRVVGRNCLVMGAVASLLGLALAPGLQIEMLQILHLSALCALYGVVAWAVAIPLAHKLHSYSEMEVLAKRMAIEAVMSIQSGDRPHVIEHKLSVFLPPARRPSGNRQPVASTPAPAPIPDAAFVEQVDRLAADLGPAEFLFADITKLTDREIQILLREVDQKALVVALVGATDEIREKLTGNMSERVRVFILSETGYVADIGAEKVAGIHYAICNQIVRMSKQGQISLP